MGVQAMASKRPGEPDRAPDSAPGLEVDESIRTLLLLMPRLVGRAKRTPPPKELQSFQLAPRHLSLMAYLIFDGPLGVNELASRLEVAPATVSLMVSDLSRQGILVRQEDESDRRRTIVSIAPSHHASIDRWLSNGAKAWKQALQPLSPAEREVVVRTLWAYERALSANSD
jgi:DNA-binding MarR family transcriptional regulator